MSNHPKRKYNAFAQQEVKALTHKKVIEASLELFKVKWIDEITLQDIAKTASVTVQTILRHFESREKLLLSAVQEIDLGAENHRETPIGGEVKEIVTALINYYEQFGVLVLRCLAQENRIPELEFCLQKGRDQHRNWIRKVFSCHLSQCSGEKKENLEDQLYAACEIYLWRIYRIDLKQPRSALEKVWIFQINSILTAFITSQ